MSPGSSARSVTEKLIGSHRVDATNGGEMGLRIDHTLTQDATGTLVMLELEAMGLDRVRTERSVQYVDHNLLQADARNPDDHLFLQSACERFGIWFSPPGNGVSHPLNTQFFARPGATLLGSDSHTCANGAVGTLAIGAGGLEVAMAMTGEPFFVKKPRVRRVRVEGALPDWVSAKDVILELLRRHGVEGGLGWVFEYSGPGLETLGIWDRHVIANMGAELGATTSVFPSDDVTRAFLEDQGRAEEWMRIEADEGCHYDALETISLDTLEPLIAAPSSPGNVKTVQSVAGTPIYQAYVGSSANPSYRDFAVVAAVIEGHRLPPGLSLDLNPGTRLVLEDLASTGALGSLLAAGARLHQVGCNGCIGMGQAPATGRDSLRTVPRNFPGRSGTHEDRVWLCSPETAAASALTGEITDPRSLGHLPTLVGAPKRVLDRGTVFEAPPSDGRIVELVKGPNITSIPSLDSPPDRLDLPLGLVLGDGVSTDGILPAGSRVLPFRSNLEAIRRFCFDGIDPDYVSRVEALGDHAIFAGRNYGQGSSREHAALAPRSLGLRVVLATTFARIHEQNLVGFGVLPLRLLEPEKARALLVGQDDRVQVTRVREALEGDGSPSVFVNGEPVTVSLDLSARARRIVAAGGRIALRRRETTGNS